MSRLLAMCHELIAGLGKKKDGHRTGTGTGTGTADGDRAPKEAERMMRLGPPGAPSSKRDTYWPEHVDSHAFLGATFTTRGVPNGRHP